MDDYQVTEFEGDDPQWMLELACNPAFARIPPENLQALFQRFVPVQAAAGQVLIRQGTLKGAHNLPLAQLRARTHELDRQRAYLVFCDDGRRAATAAFLLAQRGFDTHVLAAGVLKPK